MQSFLALTRVIAGFIQDDPSAIRAALRSAPAEKIYGQAVRHKCAAVLFETFVQHRLREPEFTALRGMLQKYAATFSLDAVTTRLQIGGVVRSLNAAGIEHILLKSAARLYAGEKLAERSQIFDLDVLVQREEADRAVRALSTEGYVYASPGLARGYRRYHHHLAPLVTPRFPKPLELHVALGPPGYFSLATGWPELVCYREPIDAPGDPAMRLNDLGAALHLLLHGTGIYRFGDAVQVALILRRRPDLAATLAQITQAETIQRIPVQAVLYAACSLVGIELRIDDGVRAYAQWAFAREELGRPFRGRMQLADAWFANGRRLRGPAMALALPPVRSNDGTAITPANRMRVLSGRILAGMALAATGAIARQ